MSPPSSMTAGRMRVSSSSLIMATTSLSSSEMAVLEVCAAGSVNSGSPALADRLPHRFYMTGHKEDRSMLLLWLLQSFTCSAGINN